MYYLISELSWHVFLLHRFCHMQILFFLHILHSSSQREVGAEFGGSKEKCVKQYHFFLSALLSESVVAMRNLFQ